MLSPIPRIGAVELIDFESMKSPGELKKICPIPNWFWSVTNTKYDLSIPTITTEAVYSSFVTELLDKIFNAIS